MTRGDLKSYLRSLRPDTEVSFAGFFSFLKMPLVLRQNGGSDTLHVSSADTSLFHLEGCKRAVPCFALVNSSPDFTYLSPVNKAVAHTPYWSLISPDNILSNCRLEWERTTCRKLSSGQAVLFHCSKYCPLKFCFLLLYFVTFFISTWTLTSLIWS